jgi:hypothetical protein
MTPTCDPNVVIESSTETSVIYLVPATGERWRIDGTCNQCGLCWDGAVGDRPTLDCPVRPEIKDNFPDCTLSGEYL